MQDPTLDFQDPTLDFLDFSELALAVGSTAMNIQIQQQLILQMLQQMGNHIQMLEQQLQIQPQYVAQPQSGWSIGAGGGFMNNLSSGLAFGAGFGIAEDVVSDIFNSF